MDDKTVLIGAAPYVTIPLAALITGLSEKAIRRKIEDGKWVEGKEFRRSPDGGVFISLRGYEKWVEGDLESRQGRAVSASSLSLMAKHAENG